MPSSTTQQNELALVRACAKGHDGQWAKFVEDYHRLIRACAFTLHQRQRHVNCDVEDLVGHVYEKLLEDSCRRLVAWRGESKLSTYLALVVRNLCKDYLKRCSRDPIMDPFDKLEKKLSADDASRDGIEHRERVENLRKAIEELPRKRYLIMKLRLEGKTLREIAATLDLPVGTVSVENSRAIEQLRKILNAFEGDSSSEDSS